MTQPIDTLRIVLSGPVASGKTTLAKGLSTRLNLRVVEEKLDVIYRASGKFQRLLTAAGAGAAQIAAAKAELLRAFVQWSQDRSVEYDKPGGFIADRWEADLLDTWLAFFGAERNVDHVTAVLIEDLTRKAAGIDLVVVTPLQKPFSDSPNADGLNRIMSLTTRFRGSVTTLGIIHSAPCRAVFQIPNARLSATERIDLVEQFIQRVL